MANKQHKKLGTPTIYNGVLDELRNPNMNFGVHAYCNFIGETIRLDEAIQLAVKFWDFSDLRIVDYKANITYYFS